MRPNTSKPIEAPTAKSRLWPEMLKNASKWSKTDRTCVSQMNPLARNYRKCVHASKAIEAPSAKSRLWPEMFENASTCFTTDRTCVNKMKRVIRNYRKCVQMLQIRSKLRQPSHDFGQKCSKMLPNVSQAVEPPSAKSSIRPEMFENASTCFKNSQANVN